MKILIAAATEAEIQPFIDHVKKDWKQSGDAFIHKDHLLRICVTGVGMMATSYALTKALQADKYDFALQAGIAGSFDRDIDLAQIVLVQSEQLGDLGAEDREKFIDITELGFLDPNAYPFNEGKLDCPLHDIPFAYRLLTVSGLTINTGSGHEPTIRRRNDSYGCQTESMEGAAFHYICLMEKIPFAQVRSISNYIEPRDRSKWKIKDAVVSLNKWMIGLAGYLP